MQDCTGVLYYQTILQLTFAREMSEPVIYRMPFVHVFSYPDGKSVGSMQMLVQKLNPAAASLGLVSQKKKRTDLRSLWTTSASRARGQNLHCCCGAVSHAGGNRKSGGRLEFHKRQNCCLSVPVCVRVLNGSPRWAQM